MINGVPNYNTFCEEDFLNKLRRLTLYHIQNQGWLYT